MAKSEELKARITNQIKEEWYSDDAGADWKDFLEEEVGLDGDLFQKITHTRNWKRTHKGSEDGFIQREFSFQLDKDQEWVLTATVTCDEDDNFLDIEFQVY